ncbi:LOW QUALITY PROTEIN: uncharacterized protein LOC129230566 [Uloborus diversus]|uniref:LOW QUALITY PROTEIN: uncharacterized protein LOC129230566 n=1 Tax=Uloborus diversus TaxID=327109 RepID=UPI0024098498|nr:LOW QUALITY PROTEIN: uncharacterized protein LOC129230566 [Uloborus diversus]
MLSILLTLFVIAGFGLSLFLIVLLFLNPKNYRISDGDPTIIILKLVEAHRETLPVNTSHGWNLASCSSSLRCWKKELSFNIIGSPLVVYACSKEINCAAVILLNVIADVSTWPEWDIHAQDQNVHLELPENPLLHGDAYMQCDQLVLTTSKLKAKPEVEMFRFGNLESNGTGWILLWNAKQLDWILYIAQPIDNDTGNEESKCLLTAIWGCQLKQPTCNIPEALCTKVLNLSEAIALSQLKIRPFESMVHASFKYPHVPTIHSALSDLPCNPCVLLKHEKKEQITSFQNRVLAVLPHSPHKPLTISNVAGFSLILYPMKKTHKSCTNGNSSPAEEKRKSRRRQKFRSDSVTSAFPRLKHLDIENRRSSSLSNPLRKKLPELTVTQPEEEASPPQRSSSHSFLDVLFQRRRSSDGTSKRSRSPSPSIKISTKEKRNRFSFEKTASMSSQEDSCGLLCPDMELSDSCSDAERSCFEFARNIQNENIDFQSIGDYSITAVLQENLRSSMLEKDTSEEEQKIVSGGWIFKEASKDVTLLKKITNFDSCVVASYLSKGIINSPSLVVWKTLCNPLTRFMYDDTIKKITVLKEYPNGQKLIHMYNESVSLLRKEVQDFCILQTEKKQGNQYILGFHSVKDDLCPIVKDVVRGTIIASGWIVENVPENPHSSVVSYLVQMIVSSPETSTMEDISSVQSQCINNLSVYLSTKPVCYSQSDGSSC